MFIVTLLKREDKGKLREVHKCRKLSKLVQTLLKKMPYKSYEIKEYSLLIGANKKLICNAPSSQRWKFLQPECVDSANHMIGR